MVNERQTEGYDFIHNRSSHGLFVLGSLKPGVTAAQANEDLNAIAKRLAHDAIRRRTMAADCGW